MVSSTHENRWQLCDQSIGLLLLHTLQLWCQACVKLLASVTHDVGMACPALPGSHWALMRQAADCLHRCTVCRGWPRCSSS